MAKTTTVPPSVKKRHCYGRTAACVLDVLHTMVDVVHTV